MNPNDIILSLYPHKLTVGDVKQLLTKTDNHSRRLLADLILHRLKDRYITPLEKVPIKFRSGFLTMAAACLLIETFQCFKKGEPDTRGFRKGEAAFGRFFSAHAAKFPGIDGVEFYKKIRCGILHQAQTNGHFRILRKGGVFDHSKKSINATAFLKVLKGIVEDYVEELRSQEMQTAPWPNAIKKINFVLRAIENE